MKRVLFIFSGYFFSAVLSSCDPGLNGNLKVYNESNISVTVVTFNSDGSDSLIHTITSYSDKQIKMLEGFGNQKTFDCCPCEFEHVYVKTEAGLIKKDATVKENWVISNKKKQKKFGGEDLKCELHITQADL